MTLWYDGGGRQEGGGLATGGLLCRHRINPVFIFVETRTTPAYPQALVASETIAISLVLCRVARGDR